MDACLVALVALGESSTFIIFFSSTIVAVAVAEKKENITKKSHTKIKERKYRKRVLCKNKEATMMALETLSGLFINSHFRCCLREREKERK